MAFAQRLDGGKAHADVESDIQEETRLGVAGNPSFYINGRGLVGTQPLAAFEKLIERELANKVAQ